MVRRFELGVRRQSAATPETNGDKLEQEEGTQEGGGGVLGRIWGNNVTTKCVGSGRIRQISEVYFGEM